MLGWCLSLCALLWVFCRRKQLVLQAALIARKCLSRVRFRHVLLHAIYIYLPEKHHVLLHRIFYPIYHSWGLSQLSQVAPSTSLSRLGFSSSSSPFANLYAIGLAVKCPPRCTSS
jgi:hypothetical protein